MSRGGAAPPGLTAVWLSGPANPNPMPNLTLTVALTQALTLTLTRFDGSVAQWTGTLAELDAAASGAGS